MAIRFTDKAPEAPRRKPAEEAGGTETARQEGEARFMTPIEAVNPVNPDASGELPFGELPKAEKAERKKRGPKAAAGK